MSAPASALYPLVHQYLVASGLDKAAKKLQAEAGFELSATPADRSLADIYALYVANTPKSEDGSVKKKKSKKEKKEPTAEETAASHTAALTALVQQFLVSAGMTKAAAKITADATAAGDKPLLDIYNLYLANQPAKASKRKADDSEAVKEEEGSKKSKKSKKVKEEPVAEEVKAAAAPVEEEPKSKKSKKSKKEEAAPVVEEATTVVKKEEEDGSKKKSKKDKKVKQEESTSEAESPAAATAAAVAAENKETKAKTEPEDSDEPAPSPTSADENGKKGKKDKGPKKTPAPFQRVALDETIDCLPDLDNSFAAGEIGRGQSWAQKAHEHLIVTKGKGFRHEKTKKKRGTYRGGELGTGVRSIKFE